MKHINSEAQKSWGRKVRVSPKNVELNSNLTHRKICSFLKNFDVMSKELAKKCSESYMKTYNSLKYPYLSIFYNIVIIGFQSINKSSFAQTMASYLNLIKAKTFENHKLKGCSKLTEIN